LRPASRSPQHIRQPLGQFRRHPVESRYEFLDTLPDTRVVSSFDRSAAEVLSLLHMLHHNKPREGPQPDIFDVSEATFAFCHRSMQVCFGAKSVAGSG
jgi:hypothetical protein